MTKRNLHTTEAQINAAGLSNLTERLRNEAGKTGGTFYQSFSTEIMARRAQRLLYQWLWFYQDIKQWVSLKVDHNILYISYRILPEKRGRKGRK